MSEVQEGVRASRRGIVVGLLVIFLVSAIILTKQLSSHGDDGPHVPAQAVIADIDNVTKWLEPLDGPVRVRFVGVDKLAEGAAEKSPDLTEDGLAVQHLGHLSAEGLAALIRDMDDYANIKRLQLEEFSKTVTVGDTSKLAEEAGMLAINEVAIAACDAVRRGSYLTLEPPKTLLELPQCEVMSTRALMSGKQVNLVVVMPYSQYPAIKAARAYQLATREAAAQEFAYSFNSRSDSERAAMFARYQAIEDRRRQGQELTLDEIRFLHVDFGVGLLVEQDFNQHLFRFSPPDPRDR